MDKQSGKSEEEEVMGEGIGESEIWRWLQMPVRWVKVHQSSILRLRCHSAENLSIRHDGRLCRWFAGGATGCVISKVRLSGFHL